MKKDKPAIANPSRKLKTVHLLVIYFCLTTISVIIHNRLVDTPSLAQGRSWHQEIIRGNGPAPNQYRILPHLLGEWLIRAGLPFLDAFLFLRWFFTFLGVVLFHFYLRAWFKEEICLLGGLFLIAALPLTYLGYFMQPADCLGFVFFVLGYWFIRDRKDGFLVPVILLGMLNKETTVILILVYLFYRYDELSLKNLLLRLGGFLLLAAAGYFAVHQYYPSLPFYCAFYWYEQNFSDYRAYFYPLLIFSGFLFAAFHGWSGKGKFLRRSALMLPFFVLIHWTVAQISEIRLFLPLFPIIIPLGMAYFFPPTIAEDKPVAVNYLTRTKPLILYLSIWLLFAIFFTGYCRHNQKKYFTQQRYSNR